MDQTMSNIHNSLEDLRSHLPLAPQDFQVLLLLSDEPLHGYGIVKFSKDDSGRPTLELGSLYRIVSRLTIQGLIEDVPIDQPNSKRKRRYYGATDLGRRVARAEALRLRALLDSERALVLLEER
jgi:DNA-binding PadR family transcriptional regulator